MTAPPVTIVGLSSTTFNPGFFGEVKYASGLASAASIPNYCMLVGTKLTAGTAVANQDIKDIFSVDDADLYFGAGSELAIGCYQALKVPGVRLRAAAVAEAGGAASATIIVTFTFSSGTTAVSAGTYRCRIAGKLVEFNIASGQTLTNIADSFTAAVNAQPRLPTSAANVAGVETLTVKSKGARGNQITFAQDTSLMPSNVVATVSGSSAMTGGRFRFTGGTGTETLTTLLSVLKTQDFRFLAIAQNDSTSITGSGLWKDTIFEKAGALVGLPTFVVFADISNTTPTSVVQSTNDPLWEALYGPNLEAHPFELAAYMAAYRAVVNSTDPGASFSGTVIPGILGQVNQADVPSFATVTSLLNTGITPLTTKDGAVSVVRAITTKSLNGTAPDYSTLDVSAAYVPQFVRLDLALQWQFVFQPSNPRVTDDPDPDDRQPAAGVAYPLLWSQFAQNRLKQFEDRLETGAPPILVDVDDNPVVSGYDPVARRIMSLVPVKVAPNDEQIGVSVRQVV
jgi:phage tail sheath gpL-like